jgi:hypothetical protein
VLPSVETATTGLGGSQQRTSRPPGGGLDDVWRRDTWPRGEGDECRSSMRSMAAGLLRIIVLGPRLTVDDLGWPIFSLRIGGARTTVAWQWQLELGPSLVSPSRCRAPSRLLPLDSWPLCRFHAPSVVA